MSACCPRVSDSSEAPWPSSREAMSSSETPWKWFLTVSFCLMEKIIFRAILSWDSLQCDISLWLCIFNGSGVALPLYWPILYRDRFRLPRPYTCPQWAVWIAFGRMPRELELQEAGRYLTPLPISDIQPASTGSALPSWLRPSPVLSGLQGGTFALRIVAPIQTSLIRITYGSFQLQMPGSHP